MESYISWKMIIPKIWQEINSLRSVYILQDQKAVRNAIDSKWLVNAITDDRAYQQHCILSQGEKDEVKVKKQ